MNEVGYKKKLLGTRHPRLFSIIQHESRNSESSEIEQFIFNGNEREL